MFIYEEDSFSDVIRRKTAQKAALLFFYSRPPQAGTFSYKSPAAGRLLSAPQAPYQSAAQAPLFYTVPFPLFAKRHGSVRPSLRFFIPCLFHFLSKGTVVFALHDAFFTVPFPLFPKRHGSVRPSLRFFIPCLFPLFVKRHGSAHTFIRPFLPCLFPFLSKGTVAFDPHAAFLYRAFPSFCQKAR